MTTGLLSRLAGRASVSGRDLERQAKRVAPAPRRTKAAALELDPLILFQGGVFEKSAGRRFQRLDGRRGVRPSIRPGECRHCSLDARKVEALDDLVNESQRTWAFDVHAAYPVAIAVELTTSGRPLSQISEEWPIFRAFFLRQC